MHSADSLRLRDFRPHSQLVTTTTTVTQPRFPVIDAHNHLAEPFGGGWDKRPLRHCLAALDEANVAKYVDLDGGWGEGILQRHLDHFKQPAPDRFAIFGGVNWDAWAEKRQRFPQWAAQRLREQANWGAQGLKIWKPFGLQVCDHLGKLVRIADARLDPIWETAAELDWPVLIHVADPVAFFDPLDETNERWEELHAHPDWHFPSPPFPSFLSIMRGLMRLVERHPRTIFIGAHVGCYAENLAWVSALLDRCPNFYVDISARIGELGRQPSTARRFFTRYADRILFGIDAGPDVQTYRLYYRFLETADEYFNYGADEVPKQGRWTVCGLHLPQAVLKKVYTQNAERLIFKRRAA